MTRTKKRTRGVSLLLESLFGIGLFGLALLTAMAIFPTGQRAVVQGKNYSLANGLARELMEELKSTDYSAISDDQYFVPRLTEVNGVAANVTFTVDVDETVEGSPTNERKDVLVRVSWEEGGLVRRVQLETLLYP